MNARINQVYRFALEWWNAILAGMSLATVAIFGLVPPLQQYTSISVFVAANAIVWTLIEIKVQLNPIRRRTMVYDNIRAARSSIVEEIERRLSKSADDAPVKLTLIGSKLRSMSDIVREIVDDMVQERVHGKLSIKLYCIDPGYIANRTVPGKIEEAKQLPRNQQYSNMVTAHIAELRRFSGALTSRSSFEIEVVSYKEDPRCIAYIIGNDLLYWTGVTWSAADSEFMGTANPCMVVTPADAQFTVLRAWLLNRADLYSREASPKELST